MTRSGPVESGVFGPAMFYRNLGTYLPYRAFRYCHPTARVPTSRKLVLTSRVIVPRHAREAAVTMFDVLAVPRHIR